MGKDWAWKPPKAPTSCRIISSRANDYGAPKVETGSRRTMTPASTSKTQEIMTGKWGHGPGNNVCSTLLGRNGYEHQIVDRLDREYGRRSREMRKALKKQRKKMRRMGLHVEARKVQPTLHPVAKRLITHEAEQDRSVPTKIQSDLWDYYLKHPTL